MATCVCPVTTLSPRDYDAVLFDLDGVVTRSASVHAVVWKKLLDEFLEHRAAQAGAPFVPFDIATDSPRYVDGEGQKAKTRAHGPGFADSPTGLVAQQLGCCPRTPETLC